MKTAAIPMDIHNDIYLHLPYYVALIVHVALETGLRISDILSMRVAELAQDMRVCEQKTGKIRVVHMNRALLQRLLYYSIGHIEFVFQSPRADQWRHDHVTRRSVDYHIRKYCNIHGIRYSMHSWRKRFAQNIFEKTGSLSEVQKELKHNSVSTTECYISREEVAPAVSESDGAICLPGNSLGC